MGAIPTAGTDTLSVIFTPNDAANYTTVTKNVSLTVDQASPTITWNNPANITYGTPLSATQLNATASVQGTFTYTPAVGAIVTAGTDTLSVTFTPTDSINYATATKTVSLTVKQAAPTIAWSNPAPITYGTPLSNSQLDATASVQGTFTYTPAVGAIVTAGTDTLSVSFTPTDSTDYTTASATVQIVVNQATPTIAWSNPAPITYGTPLSSTQLNATPSVPGALTYSPTAGTILTAGIDTLSVSFIPTDTTNYTSATKTVQLTVNRATPVISWPAPSTIIYGTALSKAQLDATASVPGKFVYNPAVGSIPTAGTDTLTVTFTPTDTTNYTSATQTTQLVVSQYTPVITWAIPASIVYGTPLSATQLDAAVYQPNSTNPIPGTFVYSPAIGTNLKVGNQSLSVTFTPTDTSDYTTATKTISLVVTQAALTVTADSFTKLYGNSNPVFTGTITGALDGDTFTEIFSNSASTLSQPGQYPIIPAATGTNVTDYIQTVQNGMLTITKAPAITTLSLSTTSTVFALPVTFTANVASTTSGTPTGTVTFFDNGNPLNTATLSNSDVATFSTTALSVGVHTITAVYSGDANFNSSTASATSGANTITVAPLDFTIVLTSAQTVEGTYGTSRQYTFHVSPTGGYYPGVINLSATPTGPILATYTFSPSSIGQYAGPTDITLTVATRKLASLESPQDRSRRLSHIALGLFLLPLLGLRYSRRSSRKLTRLIIHSLLILSSLGAIGTITGCGAGYFDRTYPIVVTANSNGIQHTVSVDFHIDQSPQ